MWDIKDMIYSISFILFSIITCNISLLHTNDNILGISIRVISALSGIYIVFYLCYRYRDIINKSVFAYLGTYTLEIYYVHSLFIRVMDIDNKLPLFTIKGFTNSIILLATLSIFTWFLIIAIKSSKIMNFIIFGKGNMNIDKVNLKLR